jgi:hypothetical protein
MIVFNMNKRAWSVLFGFLLCTAGCVQPKQVLTSEGSAVSCLEIVVSIIQKCDYNNSLSIGNTILSIDEANQSYFRIHVTTVNEEGHERTIGWLLIDIVNNVVMDVTINPEEPIIIQCDDNSRINDLLSCE